MEKETTETKAVLGFYDPQRKETVRFIATGISYPNSEVIEFYDVENDVIRVKSVKHLC